MGQTFLEPFDLYQLADPFDASSVWKQSFFSLDAKTVQDIKNRNLGSPTISDSVFDTVRSESSAVPRPYLVVNACLIGPADLAPFDTESPVGMEYTPLYVGSAFSPFGSKVQYRPTTTLLVGGGFVEPFAFGGPAPGGVPSNCPAPDSGHECTSLTPPSAPFTLADASGTSSSAFAGIVEENLAQLVDHLKINVFEKILLELLLDYFKSDVSHLAQLAPEALYWPVTRSALEPSTVFSFGDGGILESYGLIRLLRRKLKTAVVFINAVTKLNVGYDPSVAPTGNDIDGNLPPLFGLPVESMGTFTQNNRVFPKSEFTEVVEKLKMAKQAGKTVMASCVHTVAANGWWGIDGVHLDSDGEMPQGVAVESDQQVTILWVYNDRVKEWEDQLTQTTFDAGDLGEITLSEAIEKGNPETGKPEGPFRLFPNYKTIGQNSEHELVELTAEQVNLLADLSCWNITNSESAAVFKTLLGS